jgi:hypothetical protein
MRRMGGFSRLLAVSGGASALVALAACSTTVSPADTANVTPQPADTGAAVAAAGTPSAAAGTSAPSATSSAPATTTAAPPSGAALPDFGNPAGHAYVPAAGRAVNTSHPSHVIGHGTPAGCTSAAVVRAVAEGGVITFNCGPRPVTIVMTQTAKVVNTRHRVVLDGGGKVTLSGGGKIEILYQNTCDKAQVWTTSNCYDQEWPSLTVQNITFTHGYSGTRQGNGSQPYGGGAIYAEGGQFKAVNSRFIDNGCYQSGPDLGGAAIRALAQFNNRPVYITGDTFRGGRCSNGGALSSISVQWDVLNSVFTHNKAIGWGANPSASGTAGGGSGGAIYLDGVKDNVLIAGTIIRDNTAREGGGAVFDVVDQDWGSLTLKHCTLTGNVSGAFQNYPGIFYEVDGQLRQPTVIG